MKYEIYDYLALGKDLFRNGQNTQFFLSLIGELKFPHKYHPKNKNVFQLLTFLK